MRFLIGVDDTDQIGSMGTGHRVRSMADALVAEGVCQPLGITRHQLLVSPEIPYTSHNSSACLVAEGTDLTAIWQICRAYLLRESAAQADAGLCLVPWDQVTESTKNFGQRAKTTVLRMEDAFGLAREHSYALEGLTGTHGGVIGALAAVGLRHAGEDGRFLWLPGLRELEGKHQAKDLRLFESIETRKGEVLNPDAWVNVGDWVRPILRNQKSTLIVEEDPNEINVWCCIPKAEIKALTE